MDKVTIPIDEIENSGSTEKLGHLSPHLPLSIKSEPRTNLPSVRQTFDTWQLNIGIPPEVVAVRINAAIKTIRAHYDRATDEERYRRQRERMERDLRHFVDNMSLDLNLDELEEDGDDEEASDTGN